MKLFGRLLGCLIIFSSILAPRVLAIGDTEICGKLTDPAAISACDICTNSDTGVWTGLGCLYARDPGSLIRQISNWGVGLGGGIAFLLIVYAAFQIITASGDPKRVKAGQELLTSAIAGLFLIIFSMVLLNFIGVDVLQLKGFVNNPTLK
jgi:hypothetical protein